MDDPSVSELMYTGFSVLFLLLGVVLLMSIVMSRFNPYDQIEFAGAEKLRASMDQACSIGTATLKMDMPQNVPYFTSFLPVLPLWMIKSSGDPNYVLYYESYPPGEALGWEAYLGLQNRIIAPIGSEGMTSSEVRAAAEALRAQWNSKVVNDPSFIANNPSFKSTVLDGVVASNILIGGNRSDFYFGNSVPTPGGTLPEYGQWNSEKAGKQSDLARDDIFTFNNYNSMTSFEKAAIKYEPCGPQSLCMKTRTGIYRFPLTQCGDIKYVEMVYDARNRKAIYAGVAGAAAVVTVGTVLIPLAGGGTATATIGSSTVPAGAIPVAPGFIAATTSSSTATAAIIEGGKIVGVVSAASSTGAAASTSLGLGGLLWRVLGFIPGAQSASVVVGGTASAGGITFSAYKLMEFVYGAFFSYKVQDFNMASPCSVSQMTINKVNCNDLECRKFDSYTMYRYDGDDRLKSIGEHYSCTEKVNSAIDPGPSGGKPSGQCLQVVVEEKAGGFCWTPDPYRTGFSLYDIDTQYIALFLLVNQQIDVYNVFSNTAYISGAQSGTVLKYYPQGDLETWKQFFQKQFSWGWPG